jgi:hypothetical protein
MSWSFVLEPAPDGFSIETIQLSRRVSRAAAVLEGMPANRRLHAA